MVDLPSALRTVNTPLHLPGRSDEALVDEVRALAAPGHRDLHPVPELHGGSPLRAVDMLLSLAVATSPRFGADVHDAHRHWALLRYLGVFEAVGLPAPWFGLSDAGRRVVGNQRRVLSEELGIGFATLMAGSWLLPGRPTDGVSVTAVDVDLLLAGVDTSPRVEAVGPRRPDYVVVGADASGVRTGVLECKGTKSRQHSLRQLASASEQLASLLVNAHDVPGLAVSSIVADDVVGYRAVQRWPGAWPERTSPGPSEVIARAVPNEPVVTDDEARAPSVEVPAFSSADEVVDHALSTTDDATALAGPALATSWSILADLAGNENAVVRWRRSTSVEQFRRGRRERTEDRLGDGPVVRGVSNDLTLPGGRLRAVLGLVDQVDDALTSGDSVAILAAQRRADDERSSRVEDDRPADDGVASYGSDGSALLLLPR